MKYLVNKETKEHIVFHADVSVPYPQWSIVEADSEGWITWEGGECPLPPDGECVVKDRHTLTRGCGGDFSWRHEESNAHGSEWNIIAYRPILAEKEEISVVKESLASESIFDRLKSAIAASESIPAIIAEINALLPEGYHVTKRPTHRNV